ncbi:MAG: hypothetical protein ACRDS9_29170, partial [Pseudonocardiaceae bacterium]
MDLPSGQFPYPSTTPFAPLQEVPYRRDLAVRLHPEVRGHGDGQTLCESRLSAKSIDCMPSPAASNAGSGVGVDPGGQRWQSGHGGLTGRGHQ